MSGEIPIAEATPIVASIPTTTMVEVVAPSTLQAGYTFVADVNGKPITVTVPQGGVKEGQRFTVPMPVTTGGVGGAGEGTALNPGGSTSDDNIPRGYWRDGLCDCLQYGLFHPHLWNAWCCPLILIGQVLTRMQMTWLGERTSSQDEANQTFTRMVWLVVIYVAVNCMFAPPDSNMAQLALADDDDDDDDDIAKALIQPPNPITYGIYRIVNFVYFVYSIYILVKLRAAVRERYSLPNQLSCCAGADGGDIAEDICCSLFCTCCTNAQLARHTADYHTKRAVWYKRAVCCTKTGLPLADQQPPIVNLTV